MNAVLLFDPGRVAELRDFLARGGFTFGERPHALLFAQREQVTITAYTSGKLLLTGVQAEEYGGVLTGHGLAKRSLTPQQPAFAPHAGSDESGKGDYFGPLCVATVHVPDLATAEALLSAGVRDSKTVGLGLVGPLASLIRSRCAHATVVIAPAKYNELYERMRNLNDLLAWAHARAIEDLLAKTGPAPVIVDEFAKGVLQRHLMERGRAATITEVVRGEADVAVAAASIVARADYLAGMAALETQIGHRLPRGAGPGVMQVARELAGTMGPEFLREIAKLHFTTTRGAVG